MCSKTDKPKCDPSYLRSHIGHIGQVGPPFHFSTLFSPLGALPKGLFESVRRTALDYGEASSLHGIPYIFERGENLRASRLIWVLVVLTGALTGIIWSVEVRAAAGEHEKWS